MIDATINRMTKRERVDAALRGEALDRVPVSAWRHFVAEEGSPETLAEVSLRHFRDFDWDWLKVNPRATYFAEAWGNWYDLNDYTGVFPRLLGSRIAAPSDLCAIQPVSPTAGAFAEHLKLVDLVREGIGGAHFVQTVFSPLSVLSFIAAGLDLGRKFGTQADVNDAREAALRRLIAENPEGVHHALAAISETLAGYARAVVEHGASGLFFAIVKLGREGTLTREQFAEFGVPYDFQVLRAVADAPLNLLHTCGTSVYFDLVSDYPVHAINWAAGASGNPTIAAARETTSRTLVGGVDDDTLLHGTPAAVTAEARAALAATGGRRFLLTPGCSIDERVPAANLRALRAAAES